MTSYHSAIQYSVSVKRRTGKGGKETADFQINVRFTEEDVKHLETCQKMLGGLSQADTLRQLILMFLGRTETLTGLGKLQELGKIKGLGKLSGLGKITGLGKERRK